MYLERPKSPSFTQSMEDTSTFLAAMSLHKTHIHLGALRPANWGKTVLSVWRSSVTCARSVCSPGTPALCTADRRTESAWTGRGCTSLFARTTSTKTNQTVLNGDFQMSLISVPVMNENTVWPLQACTTPWWSRRDSQWWFQSASQCVDGQTAALSL